MPTTGAGADAGAPACAVQAKDLAGIGKGRARLGIKRQGWTPPRRRREAQGQAAGVHCGWAAPTRSATSAVVKTSANRMNSAFRDALCASSDTVALASGDDQRR